MISDDGGPPAGAATSDDAVWPVELKRPATFRRQEAMPDTDKAVQPEVTCDDFLSRKQPDLDRPDVLATIIAVYQHWIATVDVDGFRIDADRHTGVRRRRPSATPAASSARALASTNS